MARECNFCGKKTVAGRTIARRGMAKRKGGVGKKTTGITPRKFKPNIQNIRTQIGGTVTRVRICTKCLRSGVVQKPLKRKQPTH